MIEGERQNEKKVAQRKLKKQNRHRLKWRRMGERKEKENKSI